MHTYTYNTAVRREIVGVIGVIAAVGSVRIEKTLDQLDYWQLLRISAAV